MFVPFIISAIISTRAIDTPTNSVWKHRLDIIRRDSGTRLLIEHYNEKNAIITIDGWWKGSDNVPKKPNFKGLFEEIAKATKREHLHKIFRNYSLLADLKKPPPYKQQFFIDLDDSFAQYCAELPLLSVENIINDLKKAQNIMGSKPVVSFEFAANSALCGALETLLEVSLYNICVPKKELSLYQAAGVIGIGALIATSTFLYHAHRIRNAIKSKLTVMIDTLDKSSTWKRGIYNRETDTFVISETNPTHVCIERPRLFWTKN